MMYLDFVQFDVVKKCKWVLTFGCTSDILYTDERDTTNKLNKKGKVKGMKKEVKKANNELCLKLYEEALKEFYNDLISTDFVQLNHCQAWVNETTNYYFLTSYSTLVAFIDKRTDTCVDMLRYTYGYTATSAKHISKFRKSRVFGGYGSGKWGCENTLTYYA